MLEKGMQKGGKMERQLSQNRFKIHKNGSQKSMQKSMRNSSAEKSMKIEPWSAQRLQKSFRVATGTPVSHGLWGSGVPGAASRARYRSKNKGQRTGGDGLRKARSVRLPLSAFYLGGNEVTRGVGDHAGRSDTPCCARNIRVLQRF